MSDCIDHGQKGNADGYGHTGPQTLHRKLFYETHGFLPEVVMHTCDNPRCINLEHLVAGTRDLNNKDRAAKGRSAKVRTDLRKINDKQAEEIRIRHAARVNRDKVNGPFALAKEFGVHVDTIRQIVKGVTHFA